MRVRLNVIELLVIFAIVGVLVALLIPSGDHDSSHRYPPAIPNTGGNPANIAGEYHQGASIGKSLSLSILPDGRYSFVWLTCTGVQHRESGYVRSTSGLYLLSPTKPIESGIERVFLPIRWGQRRYLIPPEKMQKFCDEIIAGAEPRNEYAGHFYLRFPSARADGIPDLPEKWASYLRERLIVGKIVAVEKSRVRIDLGAKDGLREGDILNVQGRDQFRCRKLQVATVEEDISTSVDMDHDSREFEHPSEVGRGVVIEKMTAKPDHR